MSTFRVRLPRLFVLPSALVVLSVSSCGVNPTETWGFVATLGNDTTSVERVTRTGNRITGEQVGRSPVVVHRRWEATLAPDGAVRHWRLDTEIPNAPAGENSLHHELTFSGNSIRVVRQAGHGSIDREYRNGYRRTVPWNAFLYASFEGLFRAAYGLPDTTRIGQYFFEGWEEGHFGYALVRRLGNGDLSISSTGLAGSGVAHLDSAGRMLSYSGDGTTYKQEVKRISDVPDIGALVKRFAADEKAKGFSRSLSPRDTMRATIGTIAVTVDYSRPLARGRTLVGGLIPYGEVWRTGANAATQITFSAPVQLAGVALKAGTYTLWTMPTPDGVRLIINGETGQWGTEYQSNHDIARVPMQVTQLDTPVDRFTIRVDNPTSSLVMEWGTFRWSAAIRAGH